MTQAEHFCKCFMKKTNLQLLGVSEFIGEIETKKKKVSKYPVKSCGGCLVVGLEPVKLVLNGGFNQTHLTRGRLRWGEGLMERRRANTLFFPRFH